jgi:hypothetical protein
MKTRMAALRELNAMVPSVPQYLDWLEMAITCDRTDHSDRTKRLGRYALVVDPMIDSFGFSKVLMDGGSSISILYIEMMQRMKLSTAQLKHSSVVFHGVVPGRTSISRQHNTGCCVRHSEKLPP